MRAAWAPCGPLESGGPIDFVGFSRDPVRLSSSGDQAPSLAQNGAPGMRSASKRQLHLSEACG